MKTCTCTAIWFASVSCVLMVCACVYCCATRIIPKRVCDSLELASKKERPSREFEIDNTAESLGDGSKIIKSASIQLMQHKAPKATNGR